MFYLYIKYLTINLYNNNIQTIKPNLQYKLDTMLDEIERYIDEEKKLTKKIFKDLKQLVKNITISQEE